MFIPGPNFCPSRIKIFSIPDPHQKNCVVNSRKYDPFCLSRILIFYPSRIQEVKKAPDPGSGSAALLKSGVVDPFRFDAYLDPDMTSIFIMLILATLSFIQVGILLLG
jgi:hypothetical protein